MKILRAFLVIHIIFSILLIVLILYGSQIFAALGWDIPWDEMVSTANDKARDMAYAAGTAIKSAAVYTASWLSHIMGAASEGLSGWVQSVQA